MEFCSGKYIWILLTILVTILIISTEAQRFQQQRFRQNNNNFNNFRPRNNFNQQRQNNQPRQNFQPRQNNQQGQNGFAFGLDTSDGRYAKFDGPVRGLPPGHGGGRFGAADCLLCG